MIFSYTWLIGLVAGFVAIMCNPAPNSIDSIWSHLLFYQVAVTITLSGAISFVGHVFRSDFVAEKIGWAKGSPFQKELGYAQLGFAIAGFMSIWRSGDFRLAVIAIAAPFYLLAGINHIYEWIAKKNTCPHNTWTIIPDLLMPLSWVLLCVFSL